MGGPLASRRREVLVLTYDFPPCRAPGAAIRTLKFVRYLPDFGWRPTVVCRDDHPVDADTRAADVVAVPSPVSERLAYQAAAWAWARRAADAARRLLAERPFDLLYASGPPFAHTLLAAQLSREHAIPLVVDFRDAWALDPFEGGPWPKRIVKRALCRWVYPRLERRVFALADAIVSNTPSMAVAHGERARSFAVLHAMVPNGFDAADFQDPDPPAGSPGRVVFLHCGRFAGVAGRSPETLLRGLRLAADTGRPVAMRFLGDASETLRRQARRWGVATLVDAVPPVSHADSVREMRRADVLVLYQAAGRGPVTPVAGKTFEYVRSGRPVLALVPDGDNRALVREHASCHRLVSPEDPHAVAAAMCELADAHPITTCEPGERFAGYERRALTGRLAAVFHGACVRHANRLAEMAAP